MSITKVLYANITPMTSVQLAGIITDETGSGFLVFGTSPAISSPWINELRDTAGVKILGLIATASAVNWVGVQNSVTGTAPRVIFSGTDTNIPGVLATTGTGRLFARYVSVNYELACIDLAQVITNKTFAAASGNTIDASLLTSGTVPIARIPLGSSSSTVCVGDDARLSDARTPTAHTHAAADTTSGVFAEARLGSGTGTATKVLRGDSTWRPIGLSVCFHALSSSQATWTDMPSAATLLGGHHRHIAKADLTGYTQCRLHVNKMGTAGASGSKLILRYGTSFGTTAASFTTDAGTSEVSCAINATDTFVSSSWIDLASGAKADVFLAIVGSGGDGAIDPQYGAIRAEFR